MKFVVYSIILTALLLTSCVKKGNKPDKQEFESFGFLTFEAGFEEQLPDIEFIDGNGKNLNLNDFRGKVVFLNFWATWCPPCRAELPAMENLAKELQGHDFVMIPLNVKEDLNLIKRFLEEYEIDLPIYQDVNGEVAAKMGVRGLPVTLLIDREGYAAAYVNGVLEWESPDFIALMKQWTS